MFYGAALPALLNSDADVLVIIGAILSVAVPIAVVAYVVHAFRKFQKDMK
jgi:predicted aconitase with swiveling domain